MNIETLNNPKFLQYCRTKGLDTGIVKLIQFSLLEGNEDALETLLNTMNGSEFEVLTRITLGRVEDDSYKIRKGVPSIFDVGSKSNYEEFIEKLVKAGLNSNGIVGNEAGYTVFTEGKLTKDAFMELEKRIPDMSIDRLVAVVINYYTITEYKTGLHKYLSESARLAYLNYKEKKLSYDSY